MQKASMILTYSLCSGYTYRVIIVTHVPQFGALLLGLQCALRLLGARVVRLFGALAHVGRLVQLLLVALQRLLHRRPLLDLVLAAVGRGTEGQRGGRRVVEDGQCAQSDG